VLVPLEEVVHVALQLSPSLPWTCEIVELVHCDTPASPATRQVAPGAHSLLLVQVCPGGNVPTKTLAQAVPIWL
jgi:hypothetical protein